MTSSGGMPSSAASSSQVVSAMYSPLALQVLALPLLQIIAWAMPSARCFFVTVERRALDQVRRVHRRRAGGFSEYISARSRLERFFLTPQCTPAAV